MKQRKMLVGAAFVGALATLGVVQNLLETKAEAQGGSAVQAPKYEVDPAWPQPLPNDWFIGQTIGVWVDNQDHVWIIHRNDSPDAVEAAADAGTARCCKKAPPVIEFDAAGKIVNAWGGPSPTKEYDWPASNHGIYADTEGFVWIGGNGGTDGMVLKFDRKGKFIKQFGKAGVKADSNATDHFFQVAKIFVDEKNNELYVADGYGNQRVAVFDADTGKFKRMWAAFGKTPAAAAEAAKEYQAKESTGDGPPQFGLVHAVKVSNDGIVYVADRQNNRIQVFTPEGKYIRQFKVQSDGPPTPVPAGFAFSPDPKQQFLYVVDSGPMRIVIFDRATLTQIGSIGMRGSKPGDFDIVHHMAVDSKGNLYTAEIVTNRRAQKFVVSK